jgi:hypothetical protein
LSTSLASNLILKETSKLKLKGKQPIPILLKDNKNDVEILGNNDEKLRLDMKTLNFGFENNSSNKKIVNRKLKLQKTLFKYKHIDILKEYKKQNADKVALNLVVIGKYANYLLYNIYNII